MYQLWEKGPQSGLFWSKKNEIEDDVDNLFMGATLYEEVSECENKEELEEWLGERGVSSHIE